MKTVSMDAELQKRVVMVLSQSALFRTLTPDNIRQVAGTGTLVQFEPEEALIKIGDPSDALLLLLKGEARVSVQPEGGDLIEVGRLKPPEVVGEMGLLLEEPRTATVTAEGPVVALRFDALTFQAMYQRIPNFGLTTSRVLAQRLREASRLVPLPDLESGAPPPRPDVSELLPVDFCQRHRVVPVTLEGNILTLGFVDDPSTQALSFARQLLPSLEVRALRIDAQRFTSWLQARGGPPSAPSASSSGEAATPTVGKSPRLDQLLRQVVAEGASDLHLSAGHKPRWRIDGEIHELAGTHLLTESEVFELLRPVMAERSLGQFAEHDADFAYALQGVARFRVNVFRDHHGVGAVLRQIPDKVLSFEQLGLPPVIRTLCENPKGLVLVTGPTGSGKSTTLAAMVDAINRKRRSHIITLEDPIEFVHKSQLSLVNQREVGPHTKSFARALKAALREDPDIVLVGEMRDLETVSLALETANTGHLVFGTLHTSTAVSTVDRIIGLFTPEQQGQVRNSLADVLRGVVAQTLCRKIGGGRIAALEVLVSNHAIANLIREGKNHQIASAMSTGKGHGNQLLSEELARLVTEKKVEFEEAMTKSMDKAELAKRLGKEYPAVPPKTPAAAAHPSRS
jgi:twitching motility protein PilT